MARQSQEPHAGHGTVPAVGTTAVPLSLLESTPPGNAIPDVRDLQTWAAEIAARHFGRPFDGRVVWAPRLRYRAGDYAPATRTIRLSLPYFRRYGADEARRILLHELCHWWLFAHGIRHREDAPVFQELLRLHGAPAKGRPMPRSRPRRTHLYVCPACGARYQYRRRVDYACGHCCRKWAGGRYDARFRLVAVREP